MGQTFDWEGRGLPLSLLEPHLRRRRLPRMRKCLQKMLQDQRLLSGDFIIQFMTVERFHNSKASHVCQS